MPPGIDMSRPASTEGTVLCVAPQSLITKPLNCITDSSVPASVWEFWQE